MKKICFYLLLCSTHLMLSQTEAEVGKNYHFGGKLLDQVDAFKEVNGYKVIDIVNDKITLQPLSEVNTTTVDVDRDDFETYSKRYLNSFRGWYSGIYTVPIRVRKNDDVFEFDNNVSLGTNIIARFGNRKKEHEYVDFSFGISLTKVNLNQENSDLGLENSIFSDVEILSPTALTASLGMVLNFTEGVNMGIYIGWDHLSSADNKAKWIYNKKPWLGIGVNVAFSKEPSKSDGKK